jgi:hypothetical protein
VAKGTVDRVASPTSSSMEKVSRNKKLELLY